MLTAALFHIRNDNLEVLLYLWLLLVLLILSWHWNFQIFSIVSIRTKAIALLRFLNVHCGCRICVAKYTFEEILTCCGNCTLRCCLIRNDLASRFSLSGLIASNIVFIVRILIASVCKLLMDDHVACSPNWLSMQCILLVVYVTTYIRGLSWRGNELGILNMCGMSVNEEDLAVINLQVLNIHWGVICGVSCGWECNIWEIWFWPFVLQIQLLTCLMIVIVMRLAGRRKSTELTVLYRYFLRLNALFLVLIDLSILYYCLRIVCINSHLLPW